MKNKTPLDYPPQRDYNLIALNDVLAIIIAVVGVVMDAVYLLGNKDLSFGVVAAVCLGWVAVYGTLRRLQIAWLYWGLLCALILIMCNVL